MVTTADKAKPKTTVYEATPAEAAKAFNSQAPKPALPEPMYFEAIYRARPDMSDTRGYAEWFDDQMDQLKMQLSQHFGDPANAVQTHADQLRFLCESVEADGTRIYCLTGMFVHKDSDVA